MKHTIFCYQSVMKIIINIILVQYLFVHSITAMAIRHNNFNNLNKTTLSRRSPAGDDSSKWPLTKTGKKIERKLMKEPAGLRTPQARETMIRTEIVRHSENARTAGQEKARLEQKMPQKKNSFDSFIGKAKSFWPTTAEHKLKKAIGQINHANTAVQNLSKDLSYHQNQGHIHNMAGISQTASEIQSGGKTRYSNKEASGSGSNRTPTGMTQSQPVSRASSPTRPLLSSAHTSSHVATPARSPMHAQQIKSSSHSAGPSRAQTPKRGRI